MNRAKKQAAGAAILAMLVSAGASAEQALDGSASGGGLWVDSVLDGLTELGGMKIRILCPGDGSSGYGL